MLNSEIVSLLIKNDLLIDGRVKKSLSWFLNKSDNVTLKRAVFTNTAFVHDQTTKSLRERIYCIVNDINALPLCKSCTNHVKFRTDGRYSGTYGDFCSRKCISSNDDIKAKKKATCIKTLGVENPFQSTSVKIKSELTMQHNHGVSHALQSSTIRKRYKETCLHNHGYDNPMKSYIIQEKSKATNLRNNNVEYSFQYLSGGEVINSATAHIPSYSFELLNNKEYLVKEHHDKKLTLTEIGDNLGVTRMTVYKYLKKHNVDIIYHKSSIAEHEIVDFIRSLFDYDITVTTNTRSIITPYELDIYIPDYNLAIEYNGLFWHSGATNTPKRYHLMKTEMCEKKGIRLVHIFDDEWITQQQKCKDTIRHLLGASEKGVFARKTTVKEISWKVAKDFLDEYHLLGAGTSGNYRIGAFDDTDSLISVMVFGRKNNEGHDNMIELKRFVTNKRNNPGLGTKMFKYAVRAKGYEEIVAFVDRRWFTGGVKDHIGFKVVDTTAPALWWTDGKRRFHRRFTTKPKLIEKMGIVASKRKLLELQGIYPIYDCGKVKLVWTK